MQLAMTDGTISHSDYEVDTIRSLTFAMTRNDHHIQP